MVRLLLSFHHPRGTDAREQFAHEHQLPYDLFIPNWQIFGKAAGPIRNREVAEGAVVFWDGKSHESKPMIALLHKLYVPFEIVKY